MPEDQPPLTPGNEVPAREKHEEDQGAGAVKTLQRDVEEFMKGERPSLISLLARGAQKPPVGSQPRGPEIKKWLIRLGMGGIAIALVLMTLYAYIIIKRQIPLPPLPLEETSLEGRIRIRAERKAELSVESELQAHTLLEELGQKKEEAGTVTEILFFHPDGKKILSLNILEIMGIRFEPELRDEIAHVKVFMNYSFFGGRLVVVLALKDVQKVSRLLSIQEKNLPTIFKNINVESGVVAQGTFQDQSYRNIDFRVLPINEERDQALAYGIVPSRRLLVISASQRGFELITERLFEQ